MEPQLGSSPEAHNLAKATFVYLVLIIAYWSKLTLKKNQYAFCHLPKKNKALKNWKGRGERESKTTSQKTHRTITHAVISLFPFVIDLILFHVTCVSSSFPINC